MTRADGVTLGDCPTAEVVADIMGESMRVNPPPPNATERSCDYESTDENRSGTLLVYSSRWDPDGADDAWDRTRVEQAGFDVTDEPDLGPDAYTVEVPFICTAVMPGLAVEVTYGPDPACEAATNLAIAVADAWGIPH